MTGGRFLGRAFFAAFTVNLSFNLRARLVYHRERENPLDEHETVL
jgi:hypothetical protein